MIKLNVSAANITVEEKETLTEGRVGLLCQFRFTDEWTGLAKTAVFDGADSRDVILNSNTVAIPAECLSAEGYSLSVGVYGKNAAGDIVIPTVYATVGKIQRSAYPSGREPAAPTPDVVAQIQQAAANAEDLARSVREDADLGKFQGAAGPKGDTGAMGAQGPQGPKGDTGATGQAGADGKSAYAYAVEGGYTGTEAEFARKLAKEIPEIDKTLTQEGAAADAKATGDAISALTEEIANLQTSGLTTAQVKALDGMFKVAAYIKADVSAEYSAFKTAFGIVDSGDTEPEKTLTSISVTYSGGDVAVGTAVADLTGIVVTAHYSDGSTETVTGYTLSGTIAEGSNTITVSYGGMTTTFAVTGIAESGGGENGNEPPFDGITWADGTRINGGGKEYTGHTNYSTMDYVNVIGINAITIEIFAPWQGNAQYIYEFYDAGKAFVSGGPIENSYISATNATYPKSVTIEVPKNAIYCRLCGTRVSWYTADGTVNVSFFKAVKITVS